MSSIFPSDTDDDKTIQSTLADRKKRKNVRINHSNKSHTSFFFAMMKMILKLLIVKYMNVILLKLIRNLIHTSVEVVIHQI